MQEHNGAPTWSQIARGLAALVATVAITLLTRLSSQVNELETRVERIQLQVDLRGEHIKDEFDNVRKDLDDVHELVRHLADNVQELTEEMHILRAQRRQEEAPATRRRVR